MKQNKQERRLNEIYTKHQHYFKDIMNEGFSQNDYDAIFNDFSDLLSQSREEAVEEDRARIKKTLNPGLQDFATKSIGKIIGEWQEACYQLGINVIFQDTSDEYDRKDGIKRTRPVKAVTESPLWAWQELLTQRCRHEWEAVKEKISFEQTDFDPSKTPERKCIKCGLGE